MSESHCSVHRVQCEIEWSGHVGTACHIGEIEWSGHVGSACHIAPHLMYTAPRDISCGAM